MKHKAGAIFFCTVSGPERAVSLTTLWLFCCLLLLAPGLLSAADANRAVHHELRVSLDPAQQSLSATDRITLPSGIPDELTLWLHAGLEVRINDPANETRLELLDRDGRYARYRLKLAPDSRQIELSYSGRVHDALESSAIEQTRGIRNTSGLIDERGSFLSAASLWYAQFDGLPFLTFDLEIDLPQAWRSVSQGLRIARDESGQRVSEHWREITNQEEIYLVAAPFTEYRETIDKTSAEIEAQVFLRRPDPRLAAQYIDATGRYIRMYEKLLGPYPYGKFALVENFWETGFGMPSFTLLGSRVIRLPFILYSSYPHEILHNWWGNGVYVDWATGNWSEGLTAYLADHLIRQQQGKAAGYRQQTLQKYRDYAADGRDFALTEFRARHSPATQAVGYGKTMMLFHMLRQRVGDEAFIAALQRFYSDYRFRTAGFADLERVFSAESGESQAAFFDQWVQRAGAPELGLSKVRVESTASGFSLRFSLEQQQQGPVYRLDVPLAITTEGSAVAEQRVVTLDSRQREYALALQRRPLRIDVDPQFDLFRKLARAETPAAFTQLFGARAMTVILPRAAATALREGWQDFARVLGNTGPAVEVVWDDQIESIPPNRAVVVLGWQNRFADEMRAALEREGLEFEPGNVRTGLTRTPIKGQSFAWVTRELRGSTDSVARAWIVADLAAALPGLARKLPHYHRYSYVAFAGTEPENSLKGRWAIQGSPLTALLRDDSGRARLSAQRALIEPESSLDQ